MGTRIELGGVVLEVIRKDIKHVHLSVHPPSGRVRIAAPLRMNPETIRVFAVAKLGWIRQQQRKLMAQEREAPREYLDRESHYVWGKRYLLKVAHADAVPDVQLKHSTLLLRIRPGTTVERSQEVLEGWYREQLKAAIPALIQTWEPRMEVKVARFFVQRMRTRWGSCSPGTGSIRLNAELAKKPRECLEYIVVHEMVHLLEPTHNERFIALLDQFMPKWQFQRELLNRLPVRHEHWNY